MHDTTPPTMGKRIAAARKQLGLTQQDLADEVGVTFQAVSKWETDASLPDVALLVPVAEALGMTPGELLTGDRPAGPAEPAAPSEPRAEWGRILGEVTKDIHGDVGSILGEVRADIYGDVKGDILGSVRNVYGNVEGNITGDVLGDVTGYVRGRLVGVVHGRVKGGVRGRILGSVIGDGINVDPDGSGEAGGSRRRRRDR